MAAASTVAGGQSDEFDSAIAVVARRLLLRNEPIEDTLTRAIKGVNAVIFRGLRA